MTPRCTRRTALSMLGTTAIGASLPWLRSPSAYAAEGDVPLRILFIEARDGCRRSTFEPVIAGPGLVASTTVLSDWAFRDVMAPLAPYRSRITMFENLDMATCRFDPTPAANAHIQGLTHMLTAAYRLDSGTGGGISIDQRIVEHLRQSGLTTRLPSLEVMVTDDASDFRKSDQRQSYTGPGQRVHFLSYPPAVWDRVYSEPLDSAALAGGPVTRSHTPRQTSIYNLIRSDYDRLVKRLGSADREKLDQMRTYRDELYEASARLSGGNRAANRPDRGEILAPFDALGGSRNGSVAQPNWRVQSEVMVKLVASALHTDTTRVGHIAFPEMPSYMFGYTNGQYGTSDAHDLTHMVSGDDPQLKDPNAAATIDRHHLVMYEQVALVLAELGRLTETDGRPLLDHTLVVVYSHLGDGSHDITRLPWLVVGDAHGYFKTGQYIRFPVREKEGSQIGGITTNQNLSRQYNLIGRPHNDLFVSLANAMGLPIDTFGTPEISTGPIVEMLA